MNETQALKERLAELETENQNLKDRHKEKSEFLYMISHQLRTPLSGIKWTFAMLLEDEKLNISPEQRDILKKGVESNERMLRLLQEIILANQNEQWKFSYHKSPLHLDDLINQITGEFHEEARGHQVHMNFTPDPSAAAQLVRADKDKIILVLENLIENAIKYNEPYGTVQINLTTYSTEKENIKQDFLKVGIHNTGIGIPIDEQQHMFKKFYRASNARKRIQTGTGLGLYTAKTVIEQHDGGIWFTSQPGEGTTFFFTLPVVPDHIGSQSTSHLLGPDVQYRTWKQKYLS